MSQQQLSSPLSYVEAIRANDEFAVVIGEGVEADADRLFVAKRWADARDLYSTLEIYSPARREKLAHCVLSCGETPSMELMGQGIDEASINGMYLHLYCLGVAVRAGSAITPQMQEVLLAIYAKAKTSDLPRETLIMMLSSCAYLAVRSYRDEAALLSIHRSACEDLESLDSMHAPSLRLIPLLNSYRRCREDEQACESIKGEMTELLGRIQIDSSPLLAIPFQVAQILGDMAVKHSVVQALCRRFANDPCLESTVSNTAIIYNLPDILEFLPDELRKKSLDRPEVKLLMALHRKDYAEVLQAADFLATDRSYGPLKDSPCVIEPLFKYLFCDEDALGIGTWAQMYFWEANFADLLIEGLAPGADRKKYLRSIKGFMSEEPSAEVVKELVELFEESQSYDDYLELPASAFEFLSPHVFAQFLIKTYSQHPDEDLFFGEAEWSWDRFIPALKDALQALDPEGRAAIERCLDNWGVPIRPTLAQNLNGMSLPDSVRKALAELESSLVSLEPTQLPYLQHCLSRIAAAVPDLVAPAVANDVAIGAYNDLITPRYLTKMGEERTQKLTKRYGAAGVLRGIGALMSTPGFDSQADGAFDALSVTLVELQGSLQNRRAYLAGVLRNRLPKLNTHWLDKQVVEAMKRGVDIEQMIDLAKGVTSWDMWSDGIESLRPY